MSFTPQTSNPSNPPGYGTSAIVAMDRSSTLSSGTSLSSGLLLSQAKSLNKGTERSLESVLHASKQKVSAIESMLRGLEISDKQNPSTLRSSSLDLGIKWVHLFNVFLTDWMDFQYVKSFSHAFTTDYQNNL